MMGSRPKANRNPTLVDVARAAFVSKTTASDALRNRPHVNEQTRQQVFAAAHELGYRPNHKAAGLANGVSDIGLIVHELGETPPAHRTMELWGKFTFRFGSILGSQGCQIRLISRTGIEEAEVPVSALLAFAEPGVHGNVRLPKLSFGVPVWVAGPSKAGHLHSSISYDFEKMADETLDHLIQKRQSYGLAATHSKDPPLKVAILTQAQVPAPFSDLIVQAMDESCKRKGLLLDHHQLQDQDQEGACARLYQQGYNCLVFYGLPPNNSINAALLREHAASSSFVQHFFLCPGPLPEPLTEPHLDYISFQMDEAAITVAKVVADTLATGAPPIDILLEHKLVVQSANPK